MTSILEVQYLHREVHIMTIMRQCDVQTDEYDHRVIMYFIICTHIIRLHSNESQKTQLSQDIYETDSICNTTCQN